MTLPQNIEGEVNLTVSEFNGAMYVHLREWRRSYKNALYPTKNGVGIKKFLWDAFVADALPQITERLRELEQTKWEAIRCESNRKRVAVAKRDSEEEERKKRKQAEDEVEEDGTCGLPFY